MKERERERECVCERERGDLLRNKATKGERTNRYEIMIMMGWSDRMMNKVASLGEITF